MMTVEIGLQLFSVRDELEKDFIGTLEQLAKIGYKNLELFFHGDDLKSTIGNLEPTQLKEELDRLGLKAVSSHISEEHLHADKVEELIEYAKILGVDSLVIAVKFFEDKESVLTFAQQLNKSGKQLKEAGLQLYYHNHFHEFQQFDGKYVLDLIVEHTEPELLKIEFDTYWALRGGIDPIQYLEKLGDRCDYIHQKDLSKDVKTINLFEKLEGVDVLNREAMGAVRSIEDFVEAGEGIMDIPGIIETFTSNSHAKYVFIEQDWTKRKQIESVDMSYQYMKKFI